MDLLTNMKDNRSPGTRDKPSDDALKTRDELLQELAALRQRFESLKEAETQCKEASKDWRRLATVVEDSNDAITVQSLDGIITEWNRGAEQMYGYSRPEALGMNILQIVPDHKRQETLDIMGRLAKGEALESRETKRTTKTGETLDVWLTETILRDESGNPVDIATTERDITFRKRTEREQKELIRKLEGLNNFKTRILGIAAHDLRNPLYVISAGIRFLLDSNLQEKLNEQQFSLLRNAYKSSNEISELLNNLLDFSKIESGKMELHAGKHDFNLLVEQKVEANRLLARGKNISLKHSLAPLPAFDFDAIKITQVINNLLTNAVKFSPKGSTIHIATRQDGEFAEFSVRDSGPGISPEDQKFLFNEFKTLSAKSTAGEKTTGLGLNIAKSFVEMHGGEIGVASEPGKGATFLFRIPIK